MHPFWAMVRKAQDQMSDMERCTIAGMMILSTTAAYEKLTPEQTFDALVEEYRLNFSNGLVH